MIVITGAAGFIGSRVANYFNESGLSNLILVDDFSPEEKEYTWKSFAYDETVDREEFIDWLANTDQAIDAIIHLGARTDTTEFDIDIFNKLNLNYSKAIWDYCCEKQVPLIYASSAATYGGGEYGYDDDHSKITQLQPLNPYGQSKQDFDEFILEQSKTPPFWAGLKFFNVYGPFENHKGRMASVIWHAFHQIKKTSAMKLFASHNPDFKDGEQKRDFVFVEDLASVIYWLHENHPNSAIYNLGSGTARTFNDLVTAVFSSLELEPNIGYIPTPEDIRDKYQYFTEANMAKLKATGYPKEFTTLESGVNQYVEWLKQQFN